MTFQPSDAQTSYLPPNQTIPESWDKARVVIEERIIRDANAVNEREIAQYVPDEVLTGQRWFTSGDPNTFRYTYRTVVDFGALPNATTKSVAHNIAFVGTSAVFTRILGAATDTATQTYLPLPYVELTSGNHIEVNVDATNVNIVTNFNYSAYTGLIVLEYIKE